MHYSFKHFKLFLQFLRSLSDNSQCLYHLLIGVCWLSFSCVSWELHKFPHLILSCILSIRLWDSGVLSWWYGYHWLLKFCFNWWLDLDHSSLLLSVGCGYNMSVQFSSLPCFWFCPMRAPPSGHSAVWVEVFSKSLICLLGLDSSTTRFRVSPEIPWVTVLSSSLSVIAQYFLVP